MSDKMKVLIGIQARSTSTRLPGKAWLPVCGVPMLERVIQAAKKSQVHINNDPRQNIYVEVCLLIPVGDILVEQFRAHCPVVEGPEHDVLSRYHMALTTFAPDYMVRVTADCPLLPPPIITAHITRAVANELDYVSNVDAETRTAPDGFDCECMSARMLEWVNKMAVKPEDREHVTTLIRREPPGWAKIRDIHHNLDLSHLKLSVDTKEDLVMVNTILDMTSRKRKRSVEKHGGMYLI